jgi:hypothetical protein
VAACLLLGWLGFRFIFPGFFSSVDWQQKNASNLEISSEKDTLKGRKIVRQFSTIPEDNKITKEQPNDLIFQSSGESNNKEQIQKENQDPLNILRALGFSTSGSISDNYLSGKRLDNNVQDTANTGMYSRLEVVTGSVLYLKCTALILS